MFRELRRKKQALPMEICGRILKDGKSGVLALAGDGGYPYAVPLNYCYEHGKIYFHCAKSGHKIDAINRCDKASFCVIAEDTVVSEKFTTYFKSVIVFGTIRIVQSDGEKAAIADKFAVKYCPTESEEARKAEIRREFPALCILEFTVEHMSGKQAVEFTKNTSL